MWVRSAIFLAGWVGSEVWDWYRNKDKPAGQQQPIDMSGIFLAAAVAGGMYYMMKKGR